MNRLVKLEQAAKTSDLPAHPSITFSAIEVLKRDIQIILFMNDYDDALFIFSFEGQKISG